MKPSRRSILMRTRWTRPCPQTFRAMACDAARRAKKPCPGNSRPDHRRGGSDRNPAEPGKDRRGAAGGGKGPTAPISIPLSCRSKRRCGKRLVIEIGAEAEVNAGLVEMIKEAFAIRNQLPSGSDDSIEAMSGRLGMNKGRLTSLVRLSYLGPEIVRALLAGSQSNALTPSRLLRLSRTCRMTGRNSAVSSALPPKPPSRSRRNAPHPTTRKRP